ncbi:MULTISPECIES: DUF1661 domain-containing protein [Porphyromonas]|nr:MULTISPECIES: DUF1661 domain-containing protein [Porphyromonas]
MAREIKNSCALTKKISSHIFRVMN